MRSQPPKYGRVLENLKEKILSGDYPQGTKLPSETQLMQEYGFSRQTVRKALEQLAIQGWIETRQGMGSIVTRYQTHSEPFRREILLLVHYPDHNFFPHYINGIERVLHRSQYTLVTKFTHNRAEVEGQLLEEALGARYAGILLFPAQSARLRENLYLYHALEQSGMPAVLISNPVLDTTLPVVTLDDYAAGYLAGQHLAGLGHKSMICLMNREDHSSHLRHAGFLAACRAYGLTYDTDRTIWIQREALQSLFIDEMPLLSSLKGSTAAFCYNDDVAFRLVWLLMGRGIRIPDEYSVLGCDDSEFASLCPVPLTTVRQNPQAIGEAAASELLLRLQDPKHSASRTFPPELIVRSSTARIS